jgi:hypothetical protein
MSTSTPCCSNQAVAIPALVEKAYRLIVDNEAKHGSYAIRAMLLDADRLGQNPDRDARIPRIAGRARLRLIWQRPCFEALLLRHLEGCRDRQPLNSYQAVEELERRWPGYEKGLPAMRLADRIGAREVRQAVEVEPELAGFLADLGFA